MAQKTETVREARSLVDSLLHIRALPRCIPAQIGVFEAEDRLDNSFVQLITVPSETPKVLATSMTEAAFPNLPKRYRAICSCCSIQSWSTRELFVKTGWDLMLHRTIRKALRETLTIWRNLPSSYFGRTFSLQSRLLGTEIRGSRYLSAYINGKRSSGVSSLITAESSSMSDASLISSSESSKRFFQRIIVSRFCTIVV